MVTHAAWHIQSDTLLGIWRLFHRGEKQQSIFTKPALGKLTQPRFTLKGNLFSSVVCMACAWSQAVRGALMRPQIFKFGEQHETAQCTLRQPPRTPHCLRLINGHLVWCQLLCARAPNFNGYNRWIALAKKVWGMLHFSVTQFKLWQQDLLPFLAHFYITEDQK